MILPNIWKVIKHVPVTTKQICSSLAVVKDGPQIHDGPLRHLRPDLNAAFQLDPQLQSLPTGVTKT